MTLSRGLGGWAAGYPTNKLNARPYSAQRECSVYSSDNLGGNRNVRRVGDDSDLTGWDMSPLDVIVPMSRDCSGTHAAGLGDWSLPWTPWALSGWGLTTTMSAPRQFPGCISRLLMAW